MESYMAKRMKNVCFGIGFVFLLSFSTVTLADEYPSKAIEYICPFGAGGPTSLANRIIGDKMGEILGQPVVVINKPGAGGSIAAAYIARSKPDGYTIGDFNSAGNGVSQALRSGITYKNSDFELLGQYGAHFLAMAVAADSKWKSVKDIADYAKKNPHVLKYGSSGVGSATQLTMELFKLTAGNLQIDHIPFKSGPEITVALLGGHITTGTFTWGTIKALYDAKKIRVLALTMPVKELPDIPTFSDAGFPKVNLIAYYGTSTPKGVPAQRLAKLRDAFAKAVNDPDVQQKFRNIGLTPFYRTPEEFSAFVEEKIRTYKWIGKEANIKIE